MMVVMPASSGSVTDVFFLDAFFLAFRTDTVHFHTVLADLESGQILGDHLDIIQYRIIKIDDFPATFADGVIMLRIAEVKTAGSIAVSQFLQSQFSQRAANYCKQ